MVSVKLLDCRCHLVVFLRKNNDNNDKHDDSTDDNHNIDNSHIDDNVDNHSYLYYGRGNHGNHRHHDGNNYPGFS